MAINKCPNSQCEYFNRPLPNNVKVCPFCGSPLNSGSQALESQTSANPKPVNTTISSNEQAPLSPAPRPRKPVLKLIHIPSGREFYFSEEDGYIGRKGQNNKTTLAIDVTGIPHEGIVSRIHARIYWDWSQDSYMIVDNNSRNGTFLNGMPLERGVNYRLNQGNSLQLGQDNLVSFTVSIS